MDIEKAAKSAVDSCIEDHIMEDFLRKERAGVINMHILDFNEELHNKSLKEEGFEDGIERGIEKGETKLSRLVLILSKDGRNEDITRVASDEEYRKALYKEFNID